MLRKIQANDLALKLNVLAVCAVFVFVARFCWSILSSKGQRQHQINKSTSPHY